MASGGGGIDTTFAIVETWANWAVQANGEREIVTHKGIIVALTGAAVLLPVAITLVVATGFLFAAVQDAAGARALFAVALVCGLLWAMNLVGLVLMLGFDAAARSDTREENSGAEEELDNLDS